jgi:Flp pilus assembly protein TadD
MDWLPSSDRETFESRRAMMNVKIQSSMALDPRVPLTEHLERAKTLAREDRTIDAGKYLRAVAREFPESSETMFLLGACYAKIGREDLAKASWRRSLELAPANHRAKAWLARLEGKDATVYEVREEGSGAISGDLDSCWDPTA